MFEIRDAGYRVRGCGIEGLRVGECAAQVRDARCGIYGVECRMVCFMYYFSTAWLVNWAG
ncbi:hypothetical protein ASG21_01860 [Chryseobacterium sp. Leaf394]|nr:hypothetical protein ASG21_01860 [Chryseobacterium sp. Leaf394]